MGSDEPRVLAANQAFYDAFARCDMEAMDDLWAERVPVACIHPGWDALHGRDEVMKSFNAILEGPAAPAIECVGPIAHVLGDAAFVICGESIESASPGGAGAASGAYLIATNIF